MSARTGRQGAVLVVSAVERELAIIRQVLEGSREPGVRFVTTGVGKAACAAKLARSLADRLPDWVIQIGCGGGFETRGLEVGDVAIATREIFADEGVATDTGFLGLEAVELPCATRSDHTLYEEVPVHAPPPDFVERLAAELAGAFRITSGPFVTISTGSGTASRAAELEARWEPVCESMEGAAAALACWLEGVPFVEIRGLSNFVGPRDRAAWEIERAVANAAKVAAALIDTPFELRLGEHHGGPHGVP